MVNSLITISIIVPFYHGNKYLNRLFNSISKVAKDTRNLADYEIIIINDSPEIEVNLPVCDLKCKLVSNHKNIGIQASRVNGLNFSEGDWILFLDQDDEIYPNEFRDQLLLTKNADIVVGNCKYVLGNKDIVFYKNISEMEYLLQIDRFIKIRNQIPSPGECLIRAGVIPNLWKKTYLSINGADDWFLWITLLKQNCRLVVNPNVVYIHNDSDGNNLSANLRKMHDSALEMIDILSSERVLNKSEIHILKDAVDFKYYQDTHQLYFRRLIRYRKTISDNIVNRIRLICLQNRNSEQEMS